MAASGPTGARASKKPPSRPWQTRWAEVGSRVEPVGIRAIRLGRHKGAVPSRRAGPKRTQRHFWVSRGTPGARGCRPSPQPSGTISCANRIAALPCHYVRALPPDRPPLAGQRCRNPLAWRHDQARHVAALGSVALAPSVPERIAFWQKLHERLARVANRSYPSDRRGHGILPPALCQAAAGTN